MCDVGTVTQGSKEEKQVMEGGDSPGRPAVLPLGGARGLWEHVGLWSKLDSGWGGSLRGGGGEAAHLGGHGVPDTMLRSREVLVLPQDLCCIYSP